MSWSYEKGVEKQTLENLKQTANTNAVTQW